jgi:hypothetical protein
VRRARRARPRPPRVGVEKRWYVPPEQAPSLSAGFQKFAHVWRSASERVGSG